MELPVTDHDVSGRTVLVTGGAGFVGSHLADALVADNELRVLDDLSTGRRENVPPGAAFFEADVRYPGSLGRAMDGVDLVFHQAAMVSVDRSVEEPRRCNETNAGATVKLLERAREEDARVVLASSAAVYGEPDAVPVPEDAPKRPASPYGIDKLAADHYATAYADLHDVETVVLRYFNVYGPRQPGGDYSGVVAVFLDRARRDEPIVVHGDGEQTRDFVHVADVVRANLAAATTDRVGEAFNVGTGRSTTIRELAETVRRVTGSDSDVVHGAARPGDVRHSRADVSRARDALGFEPAVTLEDGLATLAEAREAGSGAEVGTD